MKFFILLSLLVLAVVGQAPYEKCACPRIYYPVCASDGVTYGNPCEYECQRKQMQARGLPLYVVQYERCGEINPDYADVPLLFYPIRR